MATKNTRYRLMTDKNGKDIPCYVVCGDFTHPTGWTIRCDWHWTGERRKASTFIGRRAALAYAEQVETWMKANGHTVTLSIVPATGGVAISR